MTGADPSDEVADRGLQVERTELAWIRTALACGALTAVTARLGARSVPSVVSAGLGGLVGAAGVAAALLRIGTLRGAMPLPPPRAAVASLCAAVVAADLLALALLIF